MYETIRLEIAERKATVTLNRPQAMNAMDVKMMEELATCFEALHQESGIQILVIKGEGKVFSAGGDVKLMQSDNGAFANFDEVMDVITRLTKAYYTLPMLTIAQIHGAAAGLGFSLALGSDIVVAEENSKLAMNFIGIGLIPDGGGHFFMKERVGTVKAKQMIWEGKVMNAGEALEQGLIDYQVADGAAEGMVDQIIGKFLASPIAAMIESKMILHAGNLSQLETVLQNEAKGQAAMRQTVDHKEGVAAFVEKRIPEFKGQ